MDDEPPASDLRFSIDELRRIEVASRWTGLASPPSHEANLTTVRKRRWFRGGVQFVRSRDGQEADEVSRQTLDTLFASLASPLVPELDRALFPAWAHTGCEWFYSQRWTDDYPNLHFRLFLSDAREVHIRTKCQQPFMLPFWITPPGANYRVSTYDPRLSLALADLLPDGYPEKDRLSGNRFRRAIEE
jgi:hypothetical protein